MIVGLVFASPACGERHARPADVVQHLPPEVRFTADEGFGPGDAELLLRVIDADEALVGLLRGSEIDVFNTAMIARSSATRGASRAWTSSGASVRR